MNFSLIIPRNGMICRSLTIVSELTSFQLSNTVDVQRFVAVEMTTPSFIKSTPT